MGRAILRGFKTKAEADAYLLGVKDAPELPGFNDECYYVLDDRDYNGEWTVNYD